MLFEIHLHQVICRQDGTSDRPAMRYLAWPTVGSTPDGKLVVVFSGDRAEHSCPFGKNQMTVSHDDGRRWSEPITINDTPLDDRDTGLCVLRDGTLVISYFSSDFAAAEHLVRQWAHVGDAVVDSWKAIQPVVTDEERDRYLGSWTRRSTDGGAMWEAAVRTPVSSPHGPIELSDGRLLYLGWQWRGEYSAEKPLLGAAQSRDGGESWELIGEVSWSESTPTPGISEPHVAECEDGKLVGIFRYNPEQDLFRYHLLQTESVDGGRTWSTLREIPVWGGPPHLLRLNDGRLLLTYGHRREPYGQRACISGDNGATWDLDNEIVLRDDAPDADLGYASTVQLRDGSLYTVYYQVAQPGEKTCLMGTHWRLT